MIGVLVSGEGTNLQALIDAGLPIVAVASNKPDVRALERAETPGIETAVFDAHDYASREERDVAIATWLRVAGRRARRARRLHAPVPRAVPRLLPRRGSSTPTRRRCPTSPARTRSRTCSRPASRRRRATVHYVDEGVDTGPVIAAERVPVLAGRHGRHAPRARAGGRAPAAARGGEGTLRALISTWDKTGVDTFARGLVALGWRLVASGNTAAALEAIGLPVERVEDVTASRRRCSAAA